MFYLTTHSTHFIYGYMASDIMVKVHSDSERGNPLPPHGLLPDQPGIRYNMPLGRKEMFYLTTH